MILFSSVKLEKVLTSDALDSWEKAKYVIATAFILSLSGPIYILTPTFDSKPTLFISLASQLSTVVGVLLTYFGIRKCYRTNEKLDDMAFITRYTVLAVPMTLKFLFLLLPLSIISAVVFVYLLSKAGKTSGSVPYLFYLMMIIGIYLYFAFLNRSFKRLGRLINEKKNS